MPEPLSVAASIVSVTIPAFEVTRALLNDLNNIMDAPEAVQRLKNDVASAELGLKSLENIKESEWEIFGTAVTDQAKAAIQHCGKACGSFKTTLQHWTKHSSDGKLSWKDRAVLGLFKREQIRALSEQLQSYKLTFSSTVGIATLYSSIRNSNITAEAKQTFLIKHTDISNAMSSTATRLTEIESALELLRLRTPGHEERDATTAVKQMEEGRAALDSSLKFLDELSSRTWDEFIARSARENQARTTTITFGNGNSGYQTGYISGGTHHFTWGGR